MTTEPTPNPDIAKVSVGVPGVAGAEIPVPKSLLSSISRLFTRAPEAALFTIPWARTQVWATGDDEGTLDAWLHFLNMSRHRASVAHLFVERIMAGGNDLALMAPMFTPPTQAASPREIQKVYFRVPLTAPAIRLLLRVVQRAQNVVSTPRVELVVVGSLDVLVKNRSIRVPFTVASQPELNFQNPAAGG
jgi:hypothetical protein